MDIATAKEIIDCLPKERTLLRYFKDAYAVDLLKRYLHRKGKQKVSALRQSTYGKLLHRPIFCDLLAKLGNGALTVTELQSLWPESIEYYVLTLGIWGHNHAYGYEQVSRPGANLVLQVNFSNQHDEAYRRNIIDDFDEFQYSGHPISERRCTMAWARIDLDWQTGEALIEEVQTDWLRDIKWLYRRRDAVLKHKKRGFLLQGKKVYLDRLEVYLAEIAKHQAIWSEVSLNAAINFIADELGITSIYYHSFETGAVLKHLHYSKPPRSLYTDLPRKFCFQAVQQGPSFIANNKKAKRRLKAIKNPSWFAMSA